MPDHPKAPEVIDGVIQFLEQTAVPNLEGRAAFEARVAVRALKIAQREILQSAAAEAAERDRLCVLLGLEGDLESLNGELCARIRDGRLDWTDAALARHLILTTDSKIAIDQPNYGASSPK